MPLDRPPRRSPRLQGYDYAQEGAYFVTLCTQHRLSLFGEVIEGEMCLNDAGKMVVRLWERLAEQFPTIDLDLFVVMPNHVHGIVILGGDMRAEDTRAGETRADIRAGGEERADIRFANPPLQDSPLEELPVRETVLQRSSLSQQMQWFKIMTTRAYIHGVQDANWESFTQKLWQRSFHDHIIRNESSLNRLRDYILNNPAVWFEDQFNPVNAPKP